MMAAMQRSSAEIDDVCSGARVVRYRRYTLAREGEGLGYRVRSTVLRTE